MSQHVTESIWHFIGYMHLGELLSKTPLVYSGAGTYALETIHQSRITSARYEAETLLAGSRDALPLKLDLSHGAHAIFHMRPLQIAPSDIEVPAVPPAIKPPLDLSTVLPALKARGEKVVVDSDGEPDSLSVTTENQGPTVSVTYTVGESQYSEIHIVQANSLIDIDALRGDPNVLMEAGLESAKLHALAEGSAELAQLVQKAIDALPSEATPDTEVEGVDRVNVAQEGELKIEIPLESDVTAESVVAGRYVDGEHVGDAGSSAEVIKAQVEKLEAATEAATPAEHGHAASETAHDGGVVHLATHLEPTGGAAQEAVAGGNDLVNGAILYDLADAAGSVIVRGDVHVTDAIVQINVLQDNDTVNASGVDAGAFSTGAFLASAIAANDESQASGAVADTGNEVTNEAAFVQETGPIYGNVMLGGWPGSLIWQVDYVQGNLYDVTTVEQLNVVIDADLSEQTTRGTHFIATLGENGAMNLVQLAELGASYDLIIVGGHYYEFNAIVQVNVLLDDDVVEQVAANGTGAEQAIDAEGNVLSNDAAIVRIGGDSYKPLAGDPASLAEAIGDMQTELDLTLATGLPGNGTNTLKVLYVTGDYYDYNLLVQTNILDDSDHIGQATPESAGAAGGNAGAAGDSDGGPAQAVDAGSNALHNVALLVNVGSTSDYQFVGGEVYEDTLLVQANIVADTDEGYAAAGLHPDAVATIAALSGAVGEAPPPGSDIPHDHPPPNASGDVIGSVLA